MSQNGFSNRSGLISGVMACQLQVHVVAAWSAAPCEAEMRRQQLVSKPCTLHWARSSAQICHGIRHKFCCFTATEYPRKKGMAPQTLWGL